MIWTRIRNWLTHNRAHLESQAISEAQKPLRRLSFVWDCGPRMPVYILEGEALAAGAPLYRSCFMLTHGKPVF
jgi:hypothetical protein